MLKDNCFILTGAPGSGKSTLVQLLRARGVQCVDEPARRVIAEQRTIGGFGVSDRDPRLFVELLLSHSISDYKNFTQQKTASIFDRGVADTIAYANLYSMPFEHGWNAAREYRVNRRVFFAPCWEAIYTTDEERTMSFQASEGMGADLRRIYEALNYEVIELPRVTPQERANFVLQRI
jgi:predicted ATPase